MDVLVTGADQKQGLGIIRSLGRRGLKVVAAATETKSIGFYSKYTSAKVVYTDPFKDKAAFLKDIDEARRKYGFKWVFPSVESTLIILNEARSEKQNSYRLVAPDSEKLRLALDKKITLKIAEEQNIPISKTFYPESYQEALEISHELDFNIVLKSRGSAIDSKIPDKFNYKVVYPKNEAELRKYIGDREPEEVLPMLQGFSKGEMVCFCVLCQSGKVINMYQYHSLRRLPLTGGVGVLRETEPMDEKLVKYTKRLMKTMNWEGVAHLSYIRSIHPENGNISYTFMEVNARIWAAISASLLHGYDFPWWQWELFVNGTVHKAEPYPVGRKVRWVRGDVTALLQYLTGQLQKTDDPLPGKMSLIWQNIRDSFDSSIENDIFNKDDPRPGRKERLRIIKSSLHMMKTALARKIKGVK